ncbi:MAG: solute carrier family 10 (sodium/bile acid cotransporter) member 7 [Puniceicoccaceae bacterium 5H]|nr:MAG: solute carrier family 10 (sodium/bile acid cotransporter) member 7 [Puniceicoccaceae bacterium 5H]
MIPGIVVSILLAGLLPAGVSGAADLRWLQHAVIFGVFLLQGLSLDLKQLESWREHARLVLLVLAGNFILLPAIGFGLHLWMPGPPPLLLGLFFLSVLPTTITSAVAIATDNGGDRLMALFGTALSNLASVFVTPAMVSLLLSGGEHNGGGDLWSLIQKLFLLLALPLLLGASWRRLPRFAATAPRWASYFNLCAILYLLFVAMARSVRQDVWAHLGGKEWVVAGGGALLLFGSGQIGLTLLAALTRLDERQRVSLIITGGQKSLATGIPIATLIFTHSQWADQLGLIVLPLLIYHPLQLLANSQWPRLRQGDPA